MKTKQIILIGSIIMSFFILVASCTKDSDDPDPVPPDPTPTDDYKKYLVSGSYGDIISYEVDKTNMQYTYFNETTNNSGSGDLVYSNNPNLSGVYEMAAGGSTYYGIELANEMFATSFPSGNPQNSICFGLSAEKNLSTQYSPADFAGKYLWVLYLDISDFEWGGFEILENGTFTWQFGPEDDNDFDVNTHFAGAGTGTWAVSPTDPTRIIFTENGVSNIGSICPGKIMMIDNGPGLGFTAGIKYPDNPVSQASIAGNYKWLDVTPEGYLGVGAFSLPASGTECNYYYKYYNNPYASEGNEVMTNFHRSAKVNNAFIGQDEFDGDTFYTSFLVLPGEALLFYTWGDDGMVSYGVAGKIN